MKLKKLAAAIALLYSTGLLAQTNIGFEAGDTSGWTSSTLTTVGTSTVQAGSNTWTINPYGSYMGKLQIQQGSYSSMATALGLTSTSTTAIQNMLTTQANGGMATPTTAGWVTQQVTLTAGTQFTMAWQYISTDYMPYNDGSIATLTQSGTNTATVNNYNQQYALLGFTNTGTGDYSTGSYGATGWQVATFDVSVSGTYTLGFGVFNLNDTMYSPVLFIDEVQGTTLKNGATFGAVAPNNSTAPAAPSSGGSGGGSSTPAPTATVNTGATAGTDTLATTVTVNGGTIQLAATGITLTNTFTVDSNGMTIDQNGKTGTFNGVISGTGAVTIANTGTGGGVTFAATNTYTGATIINSGVTFTNTGTNTASSGTTNAGTFTNSGTTGNVTNNNLFTNNGTAGNVTNTGGFTNNAGATVGTVTNSNTVVNSGTTGNVTNSGTFGNNATGTTGAVVNNNTFLNSGTTGSVTNNANASFTNNSTGTVPDVYNAGVFTNGGAAGVINNINVFTNTGTTGQVSNEGTFTNSGTTTDVINAGTFVNTGIVGPVTNTGTFTHNGGTVSSINNSGTFDVSGAGNTINLSSYTQSATGNTIIKISPTVQQKIVVSGAANLNGGLIINTWPGPVGQEASWSYGTYDLLTANSVNGTFSSWSLNPDEISPLGNALVYSSNGVSLKITPSPAYTQASITNNASSLSSVNNMLMGSMNGALGYDCSVVGENSMCASTGVYGIGSDGTKLGGVYAVLGRQINDQWRAGASVDQGLNKISVGNVSATSNTPSLGGYVNWNMYPDGQGLAVRASGSVTSANLTVNRSGSQYSESAQGKTSANGYAYQVKASYTMMPTTQRFNVTPYVGLRHSSLTINGYNETGAQFPLSYNSLTQSTTDALAGASVSYDFNDKLAGFASVGVIKNLSYQAGAVSGTSGIIGLSTFNTPLPAQGYTSPTAGLGLTYDINKTQFVTVSTGWQQKTLTNTSQITGAVGYTIGF